MRTTTASSALRISSNIPGSAWSKKILSTGIMRGDERPTMRPRSVAMNGSTFLSPSRNTTLFCKARDWSRCGIE
jgi:hypothetical protein